MALTEPARYVSTKKHFRIIIKPRGKSVVNNEVIRIPGVSAQFIDHQFQTMDEDIAMTLDSLIENHPGWKQKFQRVPSSTAMKEAKKQREEIMAATEQIQKKYKRESKVDQKEVEGVETFEQFRQRVKMTNPVVTGMRDVSNRQSGDIIKPDKPKREPVPIGAMREKVTGEKVADPKNLKRKVYRTTEKKDD